MDHLVADQIIRDLLNELNDFFTWIQMAMRSMLPWIQMAMISILIVVSYFCMKELFESQHFTNCPI